MFNQETQSLKELLSDKNAHKFVDYVLEEFCNGENKVIEYDFNISAAGLIKGSRERPNTSFSFDTKPNTLPREIRDAIVSIEEVTDEDQKIILNFLTMVRNNLNDKYSRELAVRIRQEILNKADEKSFPLTDINVINVEIGELPPIDFVLVINKKTERDGDESFSHVSVDLMDEYIQTGKELNEIVAEKKESNDPDYDNVDSVYKKKSEYECYIDMFVDYGVGSACK